MQQQTALRIIKTMHTVVWAVLASCVVAIPVATAFARRDIALWLIAIVLIEVLILGLNRLRCPLTDLAARYTQDRQDNFDIYLPLWLARYNKALFGTLFVAGTCYTLLA